MGYSIKESWLNALACCAFDFLYLGIFSLFLVFCDGLMIIIISVFASFIDLIGRINNCCFLTMIVVSKLSFAS